MALIININRATSFDQDIFWLRRGSMRDKCVMGWFRWERKSVIELSSQANIILLNWARALKQISLDLTPKSSSGLSQAEFALILWGYWRRGALIRSLTFWGNILVKSACHQEAIRNTYAVDVTLDVSHADCPTRIKRVGYFWCSIDVVCILWGSQIGTWSKETLLLWQRALFFSQDATETQKREVARVLGGDCGQACVLEGDLLDVGSLTERGFDPVFDCWETCSGHKCLLSRSYQEATRNRYAVHATLHFSHADFPKRIKRVRWKSGVTST